MNPLCYRFKPGIYLFGTNSLSGGLYSIHSLLQMYLLHVFVWMKRCPGACADPESFVRGGPNLITFFFS